MRALITGGTGLLGQELLASLPDAVVLTRDPAHATHRLGFVEARRWRPETDPAPIDALRGIEAIFHLAGEPVSEGRWSAGKKRRIRDSRVVGTRNLVAGLAALESRPEVLVSASAVGYYGDRGDEELDEESPGGRGFLAQVCQDWEREARAATQLGLRVVCVRIGVVLAPGGGALARMLTPFKMGAGGRLGSGAQWMPWVHVEDVAGIMLHASRCQDIHGAINAVSPHPARNADFTRALAQAVNRPAQLSVPKTALRIAFGEMSEVLLASQRVFPRMAERSGYEFKHTQLGEAVSAAVIGASRGSAA